MACGALRSRVVQRGLRIGATVLSVLAGTLALAGCGSSPPALPHYTSTSPAYHQGYATGIAIAKAGVRPPGAVTRCAAEDPYFPTADPAAPVMRDFAAGCGNGYQHERSLLGR